MAIINGISITTPIITGSTVAQSAVTNGVYFENLGTLQQSTSLKWIPASSTLSLVNITATGGIGIAAPAGQYYPTLSFSNNGGSAQGFIRGYNGKLGMSNVLIEAGSSLGVNFSFFDAIYAQLQVKAKDTLAASNSFGVLNSAITGYHLKVNNAGNVQVGVGGLSICRTDNPGGTLIGTITYRTDGSFGMNLPLTLTKIISPTYAASYVQLDGYRIINQTSGSWADAPDAFVFQSNGGQGLNSANNNFLSVINGGTSLFVVKAQGNVGIGTTSPSTKLHVTINNNTYAGNTLFENTNTGTSAMAVVSFKTANNASQFTIGQVNSGGGAILYNAANTDMTFSTNALTRLTITAGGNIGVGTTNPNYTLDVNGFIGATRLYPINSNNTYITGDGNAGMAVVGSGYFYVTAVGGSYFQNEVRFRGRIENDINAYLQINGGTTGVTYFAGTIGVGGSNVYHSSSIQTGKGVFFAQDNASDIGGKIYGYWDSAFQPYAGGLIFQVSRIETGSYQMYDAMTLSGSGKVGIGTSNPFYPLQVNGAIVSQGGGFGGLDGTFGFGGTQTSLTGNAIMAYIAFNTGGSEKMRLDMAGSLGIGTSTTDSSALLQLESTTKGFLPPRMNQAERDSISAPAFGLIIYNTDREELNVYTSAGWRGIMYV